jgi:hypothetical protein
MLMGLVVLDEEGFTAIVLYYLIVREMFLRQPEVQMPIKARSVVMWVIAILTVPAVLLGIYWEPICSAIDAASTLVPFTDNGQVNVHVLFCNWAIQAA